MPSDAKSTESNIATILGGVLTFAELEVTLPTVMNRCIPQHRQMCLLHGQSLKSNINQIEKALGQEIIKFFTPPFGHKLLPHNNELICLLKLEDGRSSACKILAMGFFSEDRSLVALIFVTFDENMKEGDINLFHSEHHILVAIQRCLRLMKQHADYPSQCNSSSKNSSNIDKEILNLCASLYDQNGGQLQRKLLHFLLQQTEATTGCILMHNADTAEIINEVYGETVRDEVCSLQVLGSRFEDLIEKQETLYESPISQEWIDEFHELMPQMNLQDLAYICVPLVSRATDSVIAFACLFKERSDDMKEFTDVDEAIVKECFHYTSSVLNSTIAFQTEQRLKRQTEKMLTVAKNIFSRMDNLKMLLIEIMREARNLTQAERCSVFILDKDTNELVAKVFDGVATASEKDKVIREKIQLDDGTEIEQPEELRIPSTQGIAGHVATTGEMLNIKDAYSHPLFYRKVDIDTGFKTRNILCFPIQDDQGSIVGVAQLCNKVKGSHFTKVDEEIASMFAIYCGISILHSLMFQKIEDAQHRNRLATELMTYHMQVSDEAVTILSHCEILKVDTFLPDITSFSSIPRSIPETETALTTVSMFDDLGFIRRWRLHRRTLARFVLMVKRGYRDPAYHNWMHAFSVAHFVYICIKNFPLQKQLTELELLALFTASLCHDIDHRGTNNSFQVQSQSVLAALYSSEGSVLERHHFSQTVCILNTEGCNIFENLSKQDYSRILDHVRDIILATDLAHHLHILKDLQAMAQESMKPSDPQHHYLLLCLLMTSADLSDQTKNWRNTRSVAELIYKEFFTQGDLEKMLGQKPAEQMDREKACIPALQVSFLEHIALPLYRVLSSMYPNCNCIIDTIEKNKSNWSSINEMVKQGTVKGNYEAIFREKVVTDDHYWGE